MSINNQSYKLLGITVNLLTIADLNQLISQAIVSQSKWIIANHNLNSIYLYHQNYNMRSFYDKADYTHIDGMPIVLIGKLLKLPFEKKHRVTYADWVWALMETAAQKNWRIFYLGSKPGVADNGAQVLRAKFPGLNITTAHGYFDVSSESVENQAIIQQINDYQPHVLMVGMGMPRQEVWILDNIHNIKTNIILPSGACLDYVAGAIPTPPRWMGRAGLEWLYRLLTEPGRLWKRYLIEPWFVAMLLVNDLGRRYVLKKL